VLVGHSDQRVLWTAQLHFDLALVLPQPAMRRRRSMALALQGAISFETMRSAQLGSVTAANRRVD
jgi:hypothetical protein